MKQTFEQDGFVVVDQVLDPRDINVLMDSVANEKSAGSRNLLDDETIKRTAVQLRSCSQLKGLLNDYVAVQCTSFIKSQSRNWAVRLHRDRVIPAKGGNGWDASGTKDGMEFVRPPHEILKDFIAVRLSLDEANEGDLQVVPGSHQNAKKSKRAEAVSIPVKKGGALVMRPLLEHASTKLMHSSTRRVLHFLFGPPTLPHGYSWYHVV